ncbi:MAG: condensation domain-containing protein, partial [Psychrosphaera sp.]|nr:condensation domain-containing protein [Psychrosphaera sp.]
QALSIQVREALIDVVSHCIEPGNGCLTPEDFPLATINAAELKRWEADYCVDNNVINDVYPATAMQQGLLFHSTMDSSAYVTQLLFSIEGGLNSADFKAAWTQVMNRHDILRTAFVSDHSGLMQQLVLKTAELVWHEHDLSDLSASAQAQTIEAARAQQKQQGFDNTVAPLMRFNLWSLGNGDWRVLWSHHHALLDGWCMPIIFGEVTQLYQALEDGTKEGKEQGQNLQLPQPKPYRAYVAWLAAQDQQVSKDFWQQELFDIDAPTPLPQRQNSQTQTSTRTGMDVSELTISSEQTAKLTQLVRQSRTTMNIVVQAAWSYLLANYANESTVVFGSTVAGRPA